MYVFTQSFAQGNSQDLVNEKDHYIERGMYGKKSLKNHPISMQISSDL
ncbi:hypothetical protein XBP1_2890021 [Xenorhabdus bovienii str. puntauvense]|uniref:Uncharacterized protein n=3 Tax=Xenorhabdus bovienii TaxID=40576 RepID=A0A0B6XB89_XENBV|nr:hypothetical protein XBFFR1_1870080 [Xenorhabdus bovienii str. feltiae France]CDG92659.1 hypothetical protein XBFFL1_2260084 [Xenorhabdus bovienii str. feltiae Florida]CDG97991.1 hypothetical protein XBP1_2890021 [Xenorhabdus bovienii str. puntauvense]CDH02169.1 hypothetical protein XBFM1_2510024 [Xenorhabdus bovienii str. feltiae Moldova]CDM90446.1 protein of unknown function [Xenorhabdus bovienii]